MGALAVNGFGSVLMATAIRDTGDVPVQKAVPDRPVASIPVRMALR